jgi:hydroxymethylglutaryl-CoA lyase
MESVKLIECPRDAWQGLKLEIPTERKVEYLRGFDRGRFPTHRRGQLRFAESGPADGR